MKSPPPPCCQTVRDDPLGFNETGDEFAKRAGQKPWISGWWRLGGGWPGSGGSGAEALDFRLASVCHA